MNDTYANVAMKDQVEDNLHYGIHYYSTKKCLDFAYQPPLINYIRIYVSKSYHITIIYILILFI